MASERARRTSAPDWDTLASGKWVFLYSGPFSGCPYNASPIVSESVVGSLIVGKLPIRRRVEDLLAGYKGSQSHDEAN